MGDEHKLIDGALRGNGWEHAAQFLEREYPDNANTNAFCAALRSQIGQSPADDSPRAQGWWEPISTAPRDRFINLWCPEDRSTWHAKWQGGDWYGSDEHGLTRTGHSAGDPNNVTGWFVTHWRDLPAPPDAAPPSPASGEREALINYLASRIYGETVGEWGFYFTRERRDLIVRALRADDREAEIGSLREKLSDALAGGLQHSSDCAVYGAPANEPSACTCGVERNAKAPLLRCRELFDEIRGDWTDPKAQCREGMALLDAALSAPGKAGEMERSVALTAPDQSGPDTDAVFLRDMANYFRLLPTRGEDSVHWANVYNAENCDRIAERLARSVAGSDPVLTEWRPIETAPRNYTDILLWFNWRNVGHKNAPAGAQYIARWDDERQTWVDPVDCEEVGSEPDYWQPLPAPPATPSKDTTA